MKHREVMRAEHHPYMYGGDKCNEMVPQWSGSAEGDMDGDGPISDVLTLDSKTFPPGTKITISVPECPECSEISDTYWDFRSQTIETCNCGFDWNEWILNKYS